VAEAAVYLATLALFAFVILASARLRHEMMLLACIPPVFVALIVGFVMGLYAQDRFGWTAVALALAAGCAPAWWCAGRFGSRDLLICIYLTWAMGMVLALVGFDFPDVA